MKKLATVYGCQKFINTVKFSGHALTHRTGADIDLTHRTGADIDLTL